MNRKRIPIYTGVIKYFPDAIREIAKVSYSGNQQHNPDTPVHWDRNKSKDELDALMRHLVDHASGEIYDEDGERHLSKVAWRALAYLQKEIENEPKEDSITHDLRSLRDIVPNNKLAKAKLLKDMHVDVSKQPEDVVSKGRNAPKRKRR